ncbi:MAG: S24/S26 family peptidase [Sulfurovum sp.]|nr:S24/S26 family peptidase [Sulfurovum sp.]
MFQIFKISGDSLYPFYKNGERVVCRKIFVHTKIHIDDTIVFEKESYGLMIKRVTKIIDNTYFVEGTTPHSIDSRNFGSLNFKEITHKVLFKF